MGCIDQDVPRMIEIPTNQRSIVERILKTYAIEHNVAYVQGMDRYLSLVFKKFVPHNNACDLNTEAKIYYTYGKIMNTINPYYIDGLTSPDFVHLLKAIVQRMKLSLHGNDRREFDELLQDFARERGSIFPEMNLYGTILICGSDMFTYRQRIKIWDHIILNTGAVTGAGLNIQKFTKEIEPIIAATVALDHKIIKNTGYCIKQYDTLA